MTVKRVCFVKDDIPFELDLEEVSVPEKECMTQGQSVMQTAEDTEGLKLIACDQQRRCSLFKADAAVLEEGILASLGSGPWQNTDNIGISTTFGYSTLYMITPDGRNYNCRNLWFIEYMGQGPGELKKREDALVELKKKVMSKAEENLKEGLVGGKVSIKRKFTDIGTPRKINPNPFAMAAETGIDPFMMTSLDEPAASDDEISLAFLRWVDGAEDKGINECLNGAKLFITIDNLGSTVFGRFYPNAAVYYPAEKEILIGPDMIDNIMSGDEVVRDVVAHECAHHDFNVSYVRDEIRNLAYDAAMSVRAELAERRVSNVLAAEATAAPLILASEANANEIIAYTVGANSTEIYSTLMRLRYIEASYPPRTALYLFERLHETVAADGHMELGLKISLLDKIEGFINNVRNQLGS